jgi:hypothetical protein
MLSQLKDDNVRAATGAAWDWRPYWEAAENLTCPLNRPDEW